MTKYILSDLFEGDYRVSQRFGANPSYYKKFGFKGHEGTDFATPVGVWVVSPFKSGKILRTGWDPAYGYYVVIWDPKQCIAIWYCHLSSINVMPGQVVNKGFRVGKTGSSGNSTGPHLHVNFFETDTVANRLNRGNGYNGGKDILDPKLVQFNL